MGSAATVVPIAHMIKSSGYEATFLWFGLGQGLIVFLLGMALFAPPAHVLASVRSTVKRAVYNASPKQVLASPIFWVMYLIFVMMAAGGLWQPRNSARSRRTSACRIRRCRCSG